MIDCRVRTSPIIHAGLRLQLSRHYISRSYVAKHALITGGAGFIGINLAHRLLSRGTAVTILDNLSRRGTDTNLSWLRAQHGQDSIRFCHSSVTNVDALTEAVRGADVIYHLAGQVAVTQSLRDPRADFEANALGTFNALEAARASPSAPVFLFASTNKVYGGLEDVAIREGRTRYGFADLPQGVPETRALIARALSGELISEQAAFLAGQKKPPV